MRGVVLDDSSFSWCEGCGEQWVQSNHAALAAKHRAKTGHGTVTRTERTTLHGAAPELPGQLKLVEEAA